MRLVIGGYYYPTLEAQSLKIDRAISDPVPTCLLNLIDNTSAITITEMSELLVLDDKLIANPTANILQNPTLNPYTSHWSSNTVSGLVFTQNGGGGLTMTFTNVSSTAGNLLQDTQTALVSASTSASGIVGLVTPGQTYMLSCTLTGSQTSGAVKGQLGYNCFATAGVSLSSGNSTALAPSGTPKTLQVSFTAPAGTTYIEVTLQYTFGNSTNSAVCTFTNVQLEPQWFPFLTYPTPFCGLPSDVNSYLLPNNTWIRQSRKFGGYVTHINAGSYLGNVRTLTVTAEGYAWLAATHLLNRAYTNTADSAIISDVVNNLIWPTQFTTLHVVTGYTINSGNYNYIDIRSVFDGIAALSGFFWRADDYQDIWSQPPGYNTMPISLICDNSSTPDMVSTFTAYDFSVETDFTQPCNQCTVVGQVSGATQAVRVIDPNSQAKYGQAFEKIINDSSLQSYADMVQRGTAEVLLYAYARQIVHLKTNVNLDPGYGVAVTSVTDGFNQSVLLIQKVSASWLGVDETLTDKWEYSADLGQYSPSFSNILKHINYKASVSSSSIPAVNQIRLVIVEPLGIAESENVHV
jgi:hypothetical protein